MLKKILVAYDGGKKAHKALEIATEIAKNCDAELYIFSSVKMPSMVASVVDRVMLKDLEDKSLEYFKSEMKEAEEKVKSQGVPVRTLTVRDSPGPAIVDFAEKEKIDLIAMGSRNRGIIEGLILGLGSVSNYVTHNARCPVMITKD
ncbi:MAG: universal stress protein [Peptococcaceae bacterium]|nr:universal stress protein [Candidatus Syntrophopropionicum ammoniitolerans]